MALDNPPIERNRILASLPPKEHRLLREHLDLVTLRSKEVLNEVDSPLRHLHFPVDSAISLMDFKVGGGMVEVAVVGKEGCTGFTVVQGYKNALCRVLVQVGGLAFRMGASSMIRVLPQLPLFRYALSRFSTTILREAIVAVGCSQFHSVEQRLARWFLAHQHRTGISVFPFTHDFLAEQLGVQRATVSEALGDLQDKKIIRYGYREVELTNIRSIANLACVSLPTVKDEIDGILRDIKSDAT